ncbi:MAG TPA: ABC transporter permease, partial [Puia sp.]|nr:ABC transporter permease [Puia sp.]
MSSIDARLALRQLKKNKGFTALNLLGLTLGLTTFLLIVLYVTDELAYDRYNTKANRIVRIHTDVCLHYVVTPFAVASPPVAAQLAKTCPEVEKAVRVLPEDDHLFRHGSENIGEPRLAFVDPGFFDVFTLPAIEGDPARAILDPRSAVITATIAKRYFHTTHAVGLTLYEAGDTAAYTVRAVIADMPAQSQFHYDIFYSMLGNGMDHNQSFYAIRRMSTYVLLRPGAPRPAFDRKLTEFMRRFAPEYAGMEKDNNGSYYVHLTEMPLTDIHLHSNRSDELEANGSIQYVYIFSVIAFLVLLVAGVNFMNLATARSVKRAREIGVRKLLGSQRRALIAQFLSESVLMTGAAAILAFGLTALLLPWFNRLTGKELSLSASVLRWLLPSLLGIVAIVGLGSGAWPAFFLSAFRPVQVLKGKLFLGGKGSGFRNVLVVVQFTISVFLIVGTLVVFRQLNYIRNRDLGFNRSQVLVVKNLDGLAGPPGAGSITPVLDFLKNEVRTWTGVTGVTLTSFLPTGQRRWHNWGTRKGDYNSLQTELWEVDEDY